MLRDALVKSALKLKKYKGVKFSTVARNITGLIAPGSNGINHGEWSELYPRHFCSSGLAIGIATDGIVALLTVTVGK